MIDQVVLLIIALATVVAIPLLRYRGVRGRRLVAASALAFFGVVVTTMMGAHLVEITYHVLQGDTRISGDPWRYDFRTYSLQLLGIMLVWQGLRALSFAWRVAGGGQLRRLQVLGPMLITLGLTAPLIPMQALFGVMHTVISTLVLGLTAWGLRPHVPIQAGVKHNADLGVIRS